MAKYPQVKALFESHLESERGARAAMRRRLEDKAGVKNATVSRWINGESRPDRDHWQAIADVLDVDLAVVRSSVETGGYVAITQQPDAVAALQEQVAVLIEAVDLLTSRVRTQGAELARLAGRQPRR